MILKKTIFFIAITFPIFLLAQSNVFHLETNNTALVYTIDKKGRLIFRHYGKKVQDYSMFGHVSNYGKPDTNRDIEFEAYPSYGMGLVNEPAFNPIHSDGSLITELQYINNITTQLDSNRKKNIIYLKDRVYNLFVEIHTEVYLKEDVFAQWVEIENKEPKAIKLNNMYSSSINLYADNYYLTHFTGTWAGEMKRIEEKLNYGIKTIESKKGIRTTQSENPSFILSLNHPANENEGECYGGALAWSGNYKLLFEYDEWKHLNILSGVNPFLSTYNLEVGDKFTTPKMIYTYSDSGQGQVSRNMHSWGRRYALNKGFEERPIILNSWEGAYFNFDEETITRMIDDAAALGIELFVLDDGWFGNKYPRDNDIVGLGDWQVNKKKLPQGIEYLINHAKSKNIKFGIWVEPEMVSPKSELAEKHPEWIVQSQGREKITWRNQWLLDMTNPEVQTFVWNVMDELLSNHKEIAYIKWDANRHVEQVGSSYLPSDKQTHFWIDYTRGLYSVYEKIRDKYPDLIFQVCASGGGRLDYGALKYHDEYWASDNTDPLKRIFLQYSSNLIYPPNATASHVSANPNHQTGRITPLKFRMDVAMTGRLGFELQPKDIIGGDWEYAKNAIQTYKEDIRPLIAKGDLYRLASPYEDNQYASLLYSSEDKSKAVLFAFCIEQNDRGVIPHIKLDGLNANKTYRIREVNNINEPSFWGNNMDLSGDFLMSVGIQLNIAKQFESAVFILEEVVQK